MQPTSDQYGNYQSSLAGNGFFQAGGQGTLTWYFNNYEGGVPTITPTETAAGAVDTSTNQIWLWTNGAWAEVTGGGGGGSIQVLGGAAADPNVASILPSNQNLYAVYKQDSSISFSNLWFWSTTSKNWVQFSG